MYIFVFFLSTATAGFIYSVYVFVKQGVSSLVLRRPFHGFAHVYCKR